jgi:hypothetical protein
MIASPLPVSSCTTGTGTVKKQSQSDRRTGSGHEVKNDGFHSGQGESPIARSAIVLGNKLSSARFYCQLDRGARECVCNGQTFLKKARPACPGFMGNLFYFCHGFKGDSTREDRRMNRPNTGPTGARALSGPFPKYGDVSRHRQRPVGRGVYPRPIWLRAGVEPAPTRAVVLA